MKTFVIKAIYKGEKMKNFILLMALIFTINLNAFESPVTPLMGFEMQNDGLVFTVFSGGCTSKKDFRIDILESNPVQVKLVRLYMDECEAYLPLGQKIKFTWKEMGLSNEHAFFLRNPIGLLYKPTF